jgi:hypothetical protein
MTVQEVELIVIDMTDRTLESYKFDDVSLGDSADRGRGVTDKLGFHYSYSSSAVGRFEIMDCSSIGTPDTEVVYACEIWRALF